MSKEVFVATRRTAAPDNGDTRYSQVVSQGGGVESFDDLVESGIPFKQTISEDAIYAGNLRQFQVVETFDTLDKKYPEYNIKKNKGYGTKDHLEALKKYGPVKHLHRFSYAPVKACFIEKASLF